MTGNLCGKKILLTGATGGIGRAIAEKLAGQDCQILLCGRQQDKLDQLVSELSGSNSPLRTAAFDLSSTSEIQASIEKHRDFVKSLDVIVNCAAFGGQLERFQDFDPDEIRQVISVNVTGLLFLTRLVLPALMKSGAGQIMNIGSIAGRARSPRNLVYSATKAAVLSATECLRVDLLGKGVRVTVIEPGLVNTDSFSKRLGDSKKAEMMFRGVKLLDAKDVADVVLWCLSRPAHVNVEEVVMMATDQAGVGFLAR